MTKFEGKYAIFIYHEIYTIEFFRFSIKGKWDRMHGLGCDIVIICIKHFKKVNTYRDRSFPKIAAFVM